MRHLMQLRSVAAVAIGADRSGPNVAVRRRWPADNVAVKPGDLSGVQLPINDQLARTSHDR